VLSWGINETGQLGSGSASPGYRPAPAAVSGLTDVVAIACGFGRGPQPGAAPRRQRLGLGRQRCRQLGDGSTTYRLAPVVVTGLNLN
jgi:hypothetical protein